jgi:hypothetical protein
MSWTNVGDVNPQQGALIYQDPEISNGDFTAEAIETVNEQAVGGDESRFLIRRGTVYLAEENFASALATVGARLEDEEIVRPDHNGGEERFPIGSEEGMRELLIAAHAFGGIDNVDIESLVQIDPYTPYDQPRKFTGDLCVYRAGSSPWSIIAQEAEVRDDFGPAEGVPKARLVRVVEAEEDPSLM